MPKKCIGCDTIIPDGKNICPMCGAPVPVKYDPIPEDKPTPTQEEPKQNTKPTTKKCSACGMEIPKIAKVCPYCRKKFGLTLPAKIGLGFVIIFVVSGIMAAINKTDPSTTKPAANPEKNQKTIRAMAGASILKNAARNPSSFKIKYAKMSPSGAVCYSFYAQNGFGGMTPGRAVLVKNDDIITDNAPGFTNAWDTNCTIGEDVTDLVSVYL